MSHNQLQDQSARILALAIESWPALWKEAQEITSQEHLDAISGDARVQAVLLLSLSRSIQKIEWPENAEEADDPRSILPLLQALAASYSLLALCVDPDELSTELLLDPKSIPEVPFLEKRKS